MLLINWIDIRKYTWNYMQWLLNKDKILYQFMLHKFTQQISNFWQRCYLWIMVCEIWPAYFCQTTAYKLGKRNKKVFSITNHLHVFHFKRALRLYGWIAEVIYRKIIAFALKECSNSLNKSLKGHGNNVKLFLRRFLKCKWVLTLITSFKLGGNKFETPF